MAQETMVDFAVVVFREDEEWQVAELPSRSAEDLDALIAAVHQQRTEAVSLGLCSYGDDFFLALRPHGPGVRLLLSDVTAVGDWPIAEQVLERLDESGPDEDDFEQVRPVGDLGIFADLGVSSMMLAAVCADLELYPDEMLSRIAAHIGFGQQFEQAMDDGPA
jgi:putative tRNA adenosine deaminase-associated protein